ncbi:hypothetical protein ABDK56_03790 [Sphingomonas sp. ASV193]|uniref:hypothetical protein n=1 Tax=Sphingomonas sp. ASV193 TaxID=3144405 RepID=UPI0032E89816
MATLASARNETQHGWAAALGQPRVALAAMIILAIATRAVSWVNPIPNIDEQFYLYVGERIWRGDWPYLDVWDRKPPGLFLFYALLARLGGGSMLAVNLVATMFVISTAWVIRRIGLLAATPASATMAAITYIVIVDLMGGQNGQSPVFYNLFMAFAAEQGARALIEGGDRRLMFGRAKSAMLWCGLALSFKPVAAAEGIYLGLSFLFCLRRANTGYSAMVGMALAMIGIAIIPTLLFAAPFLARGPEAYDALYFATVLSVFHKNSWGLGSQLYGLVFLAMNCFVVIGYAGAGLAVPRESRAGRESRLYVVGWIFAALIGWLMVPNFYDHYALPLLMPVSLATAQFYERASGPLFFSAFVAFSLIQRPTWTLADHLATRNQFERLSAEVNQARHGGCVAVLGGPLRLYQTTIDCRLSRYVFSDHLTYFVEQGAIGADNGVELAKILARFPAVIVMQEDSDHRHKQTLRATRMIYDQLARHYRRAYVSGTGLQSVINTVVVYQRRDLASAG